MKKSIFLFAATLCSLCLMAQYDGAVGTEGCLAISKDDPRIVSWALGVQVNRGTWDESDSRIVDYGSPYMGAGMPENNVMSAVSLGSAGTATATFDRPIVNGEGKDFVVFENANDSIFLELAFVEVSSDGVNYFRFPSHSTSYNNEDNPLEGRTASHYYNLAGKYEINWGVGFDLDEIEDNDLLDKQNIRFVRLVDVVNGTSTDSEGNTIYDGVSWPTYSQGFDLTGIGVINAGRQYKVSNFEEESFAMAENSYEIVSLDNYTTEENGVYTKDHISGEMNFLGTGYYMSDYDWFMAMGFGVSNITDPSAVSTNNGTFYASASGYGLEGEGKTYLQAYYSSWDAATTEHNVVSLPDNSSFYPVGTYLSQSAASSNDLVTYASEAGLYLKLVATGYDSDNNSTGSAQIYLHNSDENNGELVENEKEWRYLDLSSLGSVNKIVFSMECSNAMVSNYFCLDGFTYQTEESSSSLTNTGRRGLEDFVVYPNPANDFVNVVVPDSNGESLVEIFDLMGRRLLAQKTRDGECRIETTDLQGGYVVRISGNGKTCTKKLIVK